MSAHSEMSEIPNSRFWAGGSVGVGRPITWSTAVATDGVSGYQVGSLWIRCVEAGSSSISINRGSSTSATWKSITLSYVT